MDVTAHTKLMRQRRFDAQAQMDLDATLDTNPKREDMLILPSSTFQNSLAKLVPMFLSGSTLIPGFVELSPP